MSRIDEAFRKAGDRPSHVRAVPNEPPSARDAGDPFQSAWEIAGPARPLERKRAPAAAPPTATDTPFEHDAVAGEGPAIAEEAQSTPAEPSPDYQESLVTFQGFRPAVAERFVLGDIAKPSLVEQYRRLAATLHHAQADQGIKVVLVTSAMASEGKTLTATNLALTLGESYRRSVLLIDADLRRPALHEVFQVPNTSGLSDGLHAEGEKKLTLVQISPRVTLLTAGRPDPDPMHVLTSARMQRIVKEAAARFDWVIIDTPPVALLPDANLLASMVDTALLVIRAGQTPYTLVQKAIEAIGRDRIMGTILNGVNGEDSNQYDYYQGYYSPSKSPGART